MTEIVCAVMQSPPAASIPLHAMNRMFTLAIRGSSQQPLDSSNKPTKATRTVWGRIQRNHLSRKAISTRNRMIHPQTVPIVRTASGIKLPLDFISDGSETMGVLITGTQYAAIRAPARWIPHSAHGIHGLGSIWPSTPNTNAGPALLQNASIRSASVFFTIPSV